MRCICFGTSRDHESALNPNIRAAENSHCSICRSWMYSFLKHSTAWTVVREITAAVVWSGHKCLLPRVYIKTEKHTQQYFRIYSVTVDIFVFTPCTLSTPWHGTDSITKHPKISFWELFWGIIRKELYNGSITCSSLSDAVGMRNIGDFNTFYTSFS
jgi:hypothetical protein